MIYIDNYLDNAATTKPDDAVVEEMLPFITDEWANPGSVSPPGRSAAKAIERARERCAKLIGADPSQIVFTSGGAEANNLAIRGTAGHLIWNRRRHIITDKTEHACVIGAVSALENDPGSPFRVSYLPVEEDGTVSVQALRDGIADDTGLVSVMYVNNETGAVNDVSEIAKICAEKGALFHTDCVQAAGGIPLDVRKIGCDFLSVSAHKIHGVKGAGALYVRDPAVLRPIISGSPSQEYGLRGGTPNVAAIVGFGKACELALRDMEKNVRYTSTLRQIFYTILTEKLRDHGMESRVHINGPSIVQNGKILNLRFDGVDAETLILTLNANEIYISAGAACRAGEQRPNPVLLAMGLSPEQARNSVRVSFSKDNTGEEVVAAAETIAKFVAML